MKFASKIFILLSIKTRIETKKIMDAVEAKSVFLSYYPLKQGLKLILLMSAICSNYDFYPTIH